MASSVATYEQMECAICNEVLKTPKVLICSHTFCELCIQEWILKSRKTLLSGIECPLCRKFTPPPKTGSDPNSWSSMLPDFVHEKEGKTVLCQPCGITKEKKKAEFYCIVCNEYLCIFCHASHSKLKMSKFHKTIVVAENGDEKRSVYEEYSKLLMCETHPDKEIEFYCEDDDELFCSTCAFLNHRSCDEVLEVKNGYEEFVSRKPLSAVSKQFHRLRENIEATVEIRKRFETKLEDNEEKLKAELKDVQLRVTKGWEKAHGQIRREMKEKNRRNKQANAEGLKECEEILQTIDTFDRTTKEIMHLNIGGPEYVIVSRKLEQQYDCIKDQIEKLDQSNEKFSTYIFEVNERFLKSLSQSETFGSFKEEVCCYSFPELKELSALKNREFTIVKALAKIPRARGRGYFSSACFIPDDKGDRLILADQSSKRLILLQKNSENELKEFKCISKPYAIDITRKYVYASFPDEKRIKKYDISADFKQMYEIPTREMCYALNVVSRLEDKGIIVSMHDGEENWELVKYDKNGHEISSIDNNGDGKKWKSCWHFMGNGNRLYLSCQEENTVEAFRLEDGGCTNVFTYCSDKLICPGGIDIDFDENIYICGISSGNIHVINTDGELIKILHLPEVQVPTNIVFSDNMQDVVVLGDARSPGPFLYCLT